jgi:hypothetical protein
MKIVREKCGEEFGEENCGEERATLITTVDAGIASFKTDASNHSELSIHSCCTR